MKKVLFFAAALIAGLAISNRSSAQVFVHASVHIPIPVPPVPVVVAPRPVVVAPAYYPAPAPVVYAPAPAYCAPRPVYYAAPRPVYYGRPRYYRPAPVVVYRERGHHYHRGW